MKFANTILLAVMAVTATAAPVLAQELNGSENFDGVLHIESGEDIINGAEIVIDNVNFNTNSLVDQDSEDDFTKRALDEEPEFDDKGWPSFVWKKRDEEPETDDKGWPSFVWKKRDDEGAIIEDEPDAADFEDEDVSSIQKEGRPPKLTIT